MIAAVWSTTQGILLELHLSRAEVRRMFKADRSIAVTLTAISGALAQSGVTHPITHLLISPWKTPELAKRDIEDRVQKRHALLLTDEIDVMGIQRPKEHGGEPANEDF